MKLTDTCRCGAKFLFEFDRESYNLSHAKEQVAEVHSKWLEAHSECRKRCIIFTEEK